MMSNKLALPELLRHPCRAWPCPLLSQALLCCLPEGAVERPLYRTALEKEEKGRALAFPVPHKQNNLNNIFFKKGKEHNRFGVTGPMLLHSYNWIVMFL